MPDLPPSYASKDKLLEKLIGQCPIWLKALILLNTFALGGLVAMELVQRLLESLM